MRKLIIHLLLLVSLTGFGQHTSRRQVNRTEKSSRPENKHAVINPGRTSPGNVSQVHNHNNRKYTSSGNAVTTKRQASHAESPRSMHTDKYQKRYLHVPVNGEPRTRVNPAPSKSMDRVRVYPARRVVRKAPRHVKPPKPIEYRKKYYPYRAPIHVDIIWDVHMHKNYKAIYPEIYHWHYEYGRRVATISAFDAYFHVGDIKRVYGKVSEVFYSRKTDEYYLYFGSLYPYHDFSVVLPGSVARTFSVRPVWYFTNQHVAITGLISVFDSTPEIVVHRARQVFIY